MVVAAGAGHGQAEPDGAGGFGLVKDIFHAIFFRDPAPFTIDHVVSVEAGGQNLVGMGFGNEVAGDLADGELVKRHVVVEGLDNPVAPRPHGALAIALISIRVCISGSIEPIPGHPLAESGGG